MIRSEVAIVGAGPAGMAAAVTLAEHGAEVCIVDEQERAGGQIYRRPPSSFSFDAVGESGSRLLDASAEASGVRWMHSTIVWGVFNDNVESDGLVLALAGDAAVGRLAARRVLLAPGAYDLPVAFPGWTLPGVMAVGGVQAFLKAQKLVAGSRFVLAGAHPLMFVVASQLLGAGADVAVVAFAQQRPSVVELIRGFGIRRSSLGRLGELTQALRRLRAHRVPILFGTAISAIEGVTSVERAWLGPIDPAWRSVGGPHDSIECDVVALGYGFVPSSELTRQAGCRHVWDSQGGWVAEHDDWMRSSRPVIFVAGELTGIAGAEQAALEGRLAAFGILRDLGHLDDSTAVQLARHVRRRLRAQRQFSRAMSECFAPRLDALSAFATDETVVCRCEEITAGSLRESLRSNSHLRTLNSVKLLTRAGMGPCQGRFCSLTVSAIMAQQRGCALAATGSFAAQPPVKPLRLGVLAEASEGTPPPDSP